MIKMHELLKENCKKNFFQKAEECSYIVIKPDGLPHTREILDTYRCHGLKIKAIYRCDEFCKLAITLYLDEASQERGNVPIIVGINEIMKEYGQLCFIIIICRGTYTGESVLKEVFNIKKNYRKKNQSIRKNYICEKDIEIEKYGFKKDKNYSKRLIKDEVLGDGFMVELNQLHSADADKDVLYAELMRLWKNGYISEEKLIMEAEDDK